MSHVLATSSASALSAQSVAIPMLLTQYQRVGVPSVVVVFTSLSVLPAAQCGGLFAWRGWRRIFLAYVLVLRITHHRSHIAKTTLDSGTSAFHRALHREAQNRSV